MRICTITETRYLDVRGERFDCCVVPTRKKEMVVGYWAREGGSKFNINIEKVLLGVGAAFSTTKIRIATNVFRCTQIGENSGEMKGVHSKKGVSETGEE